MYNSSCVRVTRTNLSGPAGHHISIDVPDVRTKFAGEFIRLYLEEKLPTERVSGLWDRKLHVAYYFCFVQTTFSTDAVNKVKGLLGPQGIACFHQERY